MNAALLGICHLVVPQDQKAAIAAALPGDTAVALGLSPLAKLIGCLGPCHLGDKSSVRRRLRGAEKPADESVPDSAHVADAIFSDRNGFCPQATCMVQNAGSIFSRFLQTAQRQAKVTIHSKIASP